MKVRIPHGIQIALAWLVFPLVPALLGQTYQQSLNSGVGGGPDPRDWDWSAWVIFLGPLLGYAYLAGATIGLPENDKARGVRRWLGRRWVVVAVGPWIGFVSGAAVLFACMWIVSAVRWLFPNAEWSMPSWLPEGGEKSWAGWLLVRAVIVMVVGWVGYGWVLVAWAVNRRARGLGCSLAAMFRGLGFAIVFLGSLFGTFWAITEGWREYFFDRQIVRLLLVSGGLLLLTGCAAQLTRGEVRRRELFQAMLLAWLIGLALVWRWWSRVRAKPPGSAC